MFNEHGIARATCWATNESTASGAAASSATRRSTCCGSSPCSAADGTTDRAATVGTAANRR